MESTMHRKHIQLDPNLEEIRNKVLISSANRTNDCYLQLITKTSKIHAGFLYEVPETLRKLCLFVSETPNKISDPSWEMFGYNLGLSVSLLKCISNHFTNQDPTYNTILAYVQHKDATIGKIIAALYDTGRLDVISRISDSINELADLILSYNSNFNNSLSTDDISDYGSLPSTEARNSSNISNSFDNSISSDQRIIRPREIPKAPFVFQNFQAETEIMKQRIQQAKTNDSLCSSDSISTFGSLSNNEIAPKNAVYSSKIRENIQCADNASIKNSPVEKQSPPVNKTFKRYGKKILLTFTTDGEQAAKEVCSILRRERSNLPRIGVVVLAEHVNEVNKDPDRFILSAFHQVDYVFPILTEGYLRVLARKEDNFNSDVHIDSQNVQFIYKLMSTYYRSNGCINDKVRCIIPDHLVPSIQNHLLMSSPIFAAWVRKSETEDLAIKILKTDKLICEI